MRGAMMVSVLVAAGTCRGDLVYRLVDEWSEGANPNGVWSLKAGTVALPHVASWQRNLGGWAVAQSAWAFSEDGTNRLPVWMKSNGSEMFAHDWVAGDVVVHSQDDLNGVGSGPAVVEWRAPAPGLATVSGAVWPGRSIGRANHWTLLVNGSAVTDGQLDGGGPYSRATPFLLAAGSGGATAVAGIRVERGDTIGLMITRTTQAGDFVGVDVRVSLTLNCYPNCDDGLGASLLNVNDFVCFQAAFAAGAPYANCDGSTGTPMLTVNDFVCFQAAFAAGCSAP